MGGGAGSIMWSLLCFSISGRDSGLRLPAKIFELPEVDLVSFIIFILNARALLHKCCF